MVLPCIQNMGILYCGYKSSWFACFFFFGVISDSINSLGAGHNIVVQDLLEGLEDKQAFGHLAKKLLKLESVGEPLNLPLSKPAMERVSTCMFSP